jgi:hypothetical protein
VSGYGQIRKSPESFNRSLPTNFNLGSSYQRDWRYTPNNREIKGLRFPGFVKVPCFDGKQIFDLLPLYQRIKERQNELQLEVALLVEA